MARVFYGVYLLGSNDFADYRKQDKLRSVFASTEQGPAIEHFHIRSDFEHRWGDMLLLEFSKSMPIELSYQDATDQAWCKVNEVKIISQQHFDYSWEATDD